MTVDASLGYRATVRHLSGKQKSAKGAPAYSLYVNRRLGRYLAAAAYRFSFTPNMVTAISATFSAVAIVLIATERPNWPSAVVVTAALVLGYALDSADGQLARLRGGGSVAGEWLDHMIDCVKISTLHLAVVINVYRFSGLDRAWLLVPMGFAAVAAASFFGMILNEQLRRNHERTTGRPVEVAAASQVRSLLVMPTDYGILIYSFLLLPLPAAFVGAYTFLFAMSGGYLLLALVKWFRDMRALDRRALS